MMRKFSSGRENALRQQFPIGENARVVKPIVLRFESVVVSQLSFFYLASEVIGRDL